MNLADYTLDIETTIPANKLRVGGVRERATGDTHFFRNSIELRGILNEIPKGSTMATWYGCRFDMPKMKEFFGFDIEEELVKRGIIHKDGMFLAKLLLPELKSHSLSAMAKHFFPLEPKLWKDVVPKDPEEKAAFYNDTPLDELQDYLTQDLLVTQKVFNRLTQTHVAMHPSASWEHPLRIEQAVGEIVQRQVDRGVEFDQMSAGFLRADLDKKVKEIDEELEPFLPWVAIPKDKQKQPPKKQFKKDGTPTAHIRAYCEREGLEIRELDSGGYGLFPGSHPYPAGTEPALELPLEWPLAQLEKLKPSQTAKIKGYLLECGWEPTMWNYKTEKGKKVKTSPLIAHKVTKEPCPNLLKLGVHWVPKLIERLAVSAKRNLLLSENCKTGLIIKSKSDLKEDIVTMASDADTCGTPTSRFTHRGIVNIPRTSSYMGKEFRSLFKARKGMKMVGWDAEGLEARMEAHYVYPYDRDYAERIVTGNSEDGTDIHTLNWKTLGLKSRDAAKTFKYAITYGARSRKISEQMGVPIATAERWFTDFWAANVGLDLLMTDLEKEWASLDNKYLLGLDGRLITTRKAHALLNSKLQGGGAVVMKHAMIIADKLIRKEFGSEVAHGLIRYHDEEQWEVEEAYADRVGAIGARSVVQAGEYLKLNVPMDANYMVGDNWSETH